MIDTYLRKYYQRGVVDPFLRLHFFQKVAPNALTFCALTCGLGVAFFLWRHNPLLALLCLMLSGLFDTLDGSLARKLKTASPVGAALDIFSDRIVEGAVVFGLFIYAPESRAIAAILLLTSILLCITSFLVVGVFTNNDSQKSFYYSPGLIERTEAFIGFALMIILPSLFFPIAYLLTGAIAYTAISRLVQFSLVA